MRWFPRSVRRMLLPVDAVVVLAVLVLCGLGVLIGLVTFPVDRRRRLVRFSAFGMAYGAMELYVLGTSGWLWLRRTAGRWVAPVGDADWDRWHRELLARALGWLIGAARRCFGFSCVVSDRSHDTLLNEPDPVLVLARHGGPGDSFVLVHFLLTAYRRRVRVVLKQALQLDPAIDVLLNRLGCLFIGPSPGAAGIDAEHIGRVADDLGPGDALLLFPEGGNWTPARRHRVIDHFRRRQQFAAAREAELLEHVLPIRPAGVLACLRARPALRIVFVAHAGLDRIVHPGQAWHSVPLSDPMTIRIWPGSPVPRDPDMQLWWLTMEWAVVDEWIDGHHAGDIDAVAS
jgi:1-acyl-sn-glycerol-3-phosphate acyltransferase